MPARGVTGREIRRWYPLTAVIAAATAASIYTWATGAPARRLNAVLRGAPGSTARACPTLRLGVPGIEMGGDFDDALAPVVTLASRQFRPLRGEEY
jgi:hypothetical protein